MVEIPGVKRSLGHLLRQSLPYDVAVAVLTAFVGLTSASKYYDEGHWGKFWVTVVCTTLVATFVVAKQAVLHRVQVARESPSDLEGCLHTLYAVLMRDVPVGNSVGLRLTLHRPVDNGQRLEQILEYVGDGRRQGKSAGRTFPSQSGIIGIALRQGKASIANRVNENHSQYIEELTKEWHYTIDDARARDPASMNWMAIPIKFEDTVKAVLYGDSTERNFLDDEKLLTAIVACVGIARFIERRYK